MKKCCKNCFHFGKNHYLPGKREYCHYFNKSIRSKDNYSCIRFLPCNATLKRINGVLIVFYDNIQLEFNFHE